MRSRRTTGLRAIVAVAFLSSVACRGVGSPEVDPASASAFTVQVAKLEREAPLPLEEVSGLALVRRSGDAGTRTDLVAVGDRTFLLSTTSTSSLAFRGENLHLAFADVPKLPDASQWEAVFVDGADRLLVLEEDPGRVFVLSDTRRLVHRIDLEVPSSDPLHDDWKDEPSSRGEGMVPLKNGHVLVAKEKNRKEKDPLALVEFGPRGESASGYRPGDAALSAAFPVPPGDTSTFVPLATWHLSDKAMEITKDVSELTVGPDGILYVLSDESRLVARLEERLSTEEDKVRFKAVWKLPSTVEKPEGLVLLPDFRAIVASDVRVPDATGAGPGSGEGPKNLFFFGPLTGS
ncbi:MAG: hypothetical protein U0169_03425 [Polyangiaceae bacterium]